MADINFPITEAIAPSTASAGSIVYTTGNDVNGAVVLADTQIKVDALGNFTTPVNFDYMVDTSLQGTVQTVAATTANTTIDLSLGNSIKLDLSATTVVTFTHLPPAGYVKFVEVLVRHDATTNVYNLAFAGSPVVREGMIVPTITNAASSRDEVFLAVRGNGQVIIRTVVNNMLSTGTGTLSVSGLEVPVAPETYSGYATPRVPGVQPGMVMAAMANGSLNATSITTDGVSTITSMAELINVTATDLCFKETVLDVSSGTMALDLSKGCVFIINQAVDVGTITIAGTVLDLMGFAWILRLKDNTATARNITFDPALFEFEMPPVLTQTTSAVDIIVIQCAGGKNTLTVLNNFG